MPWSEERMHRWLAKRGVPAVLAGSPGHDAAVLKRLRGAPVVCTDQTIAGVHFEHGSARAPAARTVGRKACARVLSDLAAAAARPHAVVLALSAPSDTSEAWLRGAIEGVDAMAREHGAALVAGDLSGAATGPALAVTGLGAFELERRPPGRDRARPGELVLLSGPVGGSLLGRHLRFEPRVRLGRLLCAGGATAMMDVSDGLALDLDRLARASRARIDLEEVPVHRDASRRAGDDGRTARWHALHDGEDHELLATISPADWARLRRRALREAPELRVVGRVRRGLGLHVAPEEGEVLRPWSREGGWIHGGSATR